MKVKTSFNKCGGMVVEEAEAEDVKVGNTPFCLEMN